MTASDASPVHAGAPRDTRDVADAVRDADASRTGLRIRAGGTWMEAGTPVAPGLRTLDVGALRGIVEYVPGDLTLTARASTTLAEIDEATRPHAQWLPLDPFAAPGATLGATLATASWGPLSGSIGLPRDLTIGLEFVDGRGIVVRGGGRVVKNVAGFDLVRLTVGAWGTLGIITEVSVRLRARPPRECTLALDAPRAPEALAPLLRTLRDAPLTPLALELVDGALARRLDVGNDATILVRLAGNDAALAAQRTLVESLGLTHEVPTECWGRLQGSLPPGAHTIRASRRPSELAALWHDLGRCVAVIPGAYRQATLERGIVRLIVPADAALALHGQLAGLAERWHLIGEQLPAESWGLLPGEANARLASNVRQAFDPRHLLNPGLVTPASTA
ncbi:MAG: FAD-binding oxidoreductase [Gemmatimonadetes bacterium]|nr:FAD-binding oxidoreductase [Gemmatimonadota bacterium]